jgi:hypothetical protein
MRAKGRRSYVLRFGVLRWGGAMFVIMTIFFLFNNRPRTAKQYLFEIALNVCIWPLAGLAFGSLTWHLLERRRRKRSQTQR